MTGVDALLAETLGLLMERGVEAGIAILPVGSLEWHCGGPLGADTLLAIYVARLLRSALGERGCTAILLPPVYYGASGEWSGYTAYGSTRTGLAAYVKGLLGSIALLHDDIVVVNGHGGNTAVLREAIESLVFDEGLRARVWLLEWWRLIGHKLGHMDRVEAALLAVLTGESQPVCSCRGLSNPYVHAVECRVEGRVEPGEEGERLLERLKEAVEGFASDLCREASRFRRRRSASDTGTTHSSRG